MVELSELVDDWNNFITLTASSKEPYIQTNEDRDKLKSEIDEEMAKIDEFKNMVDEIKFENIDLFSKIEKMAKFCENTLKPIQETELKPEMRPLTLTKNSSFADVKFFIRNFSRYANSGDNTSNTN